MRTLFRYSTKKLIILLVVLAVGGGIGYSYFAKKGQNAPPTATVRRGTAVQKVSITGTTRPVEAVDLAFERSGKVAHVSVAVGDKVTSGEALVELDRSELSAQLLQTEANVETQQAKLDDLKRGATPEDIEVKRTEVAKAEQDLANLYAGVSDIVHDAYAKANDAIRNQTAALFSSDINLQPQLTFLVPNTQAKYDAESTRTTALKELTAWKSELDALPAVPPRDLLEQTLANASAHLSVVRTALNRAMDAAASATTLLQTTVSAYESGVNTGLTNTNVAIINVNTVMQSIASQKLAAQKVRNELALKLAGTTPEAIAAQEAQVKQARASVADIRAQIAKTVLKSPMRGIATREDAKVGEIAPANAVLVSVISDDNLEIEANVPEADIAKVAIGNSAIITLDAYGNDRVFEARVIFIEPAETMVEGVATYKTKLQFTRSYAEVKSGMTANIDITTAVHEGVLMIPQRMVFSKEDGKYVLVAEGGEKTEERKVTLGIRGSDGNVEVTSGLREGDVVVTPPR